MYTYSVAFLALELKQYGITVNAYAPGIIHTDIRRYILPNITTESLPVSS